MLKEMGTKDMSLFQMHKFYLGFGIFYVTMWYNLLFEQIAILIENMNKKNAKKEKMTMGLLLLPWDHQLQ